MVGLVAAAGTIPILLLSLLAGVLADRTDKLRIVRIAQTMMLVEASVLWGFAWSGHITINWLLALVLFGGVLSAVEIPARQSLIIDLVVKEDLLDAIALNSGGFKPGANPRTHGRGGHPDRVAGPLLVLRLQRALSYLAAC